MSVEVWVTFFAVVHRHSSIVGVVLMGFKTLTERMRVALNRDDGFRIRVMGVVRGMTTMGNQAGQPNQRRSHVHGLHRRDAHDWSPQA